MRIPIFGRGPMRPDSPIISNTRVPFMEIYEDIRHRREFRIRMQAGVMRGIGEEAHSAIEGVINAYYQRFDRGMAQSVGRHIGDAIGRHGAQQINELAKDNVWPIFMAMLSDSRASHGYNQPYCRENAKDFINGFKLRNMLTKKDWKWMNQQDKFHLYMLFELPGPYNIRFPFHFCEHPSMRQTLASLVERPFVGTDITQAIARFFTGEHAPDMRDFEYAIRDTIDVARMVGPGMTYEGEVWHSWVSKSQDFNEYRERIRDCHHHAMTRPGAVNYAMYGGGGGGGRFMGYDRAADGADAVTYVAAGGSGGIMTASEVATRRAEQEQYFQNARRAMMEGMGLPNESLFTLARGGEPPKPVKPIPEGPFDWLKTFPTEIQNKGLSARLLLSKEDIEEEGANMRHCLGRLYVRDIFNGKYMAFHIDAPDLHRKGLTCGLKMQASWVTQKTNKPPEWMHDQTRGPCNETHTSPELEQLIDKIVKEVNHAAAEA